MKLVSFQELCAMPDGTIFQEYKAHYLGPVMIRGTVRADDDGKPIDFLQAGLTPECQAGSYWFGQSQMADEEGAQVLIDGNELYIASHGDAGRWAKYDDTIRFLIWQDRDRLRLARWLVTPALAVKQTDDDPEQIIKAPWQ